MRVGVDVKNKTRLIFISAIVGVLAVLGAVAMSDGVMSRLGLKPALQKIEYPDYTSTAGGPLQIVEVAPGDSAEKIGASLTSLDVVKSAGAFASSVDTVPALKVIQPGYYQVHSRISGVQAAREMVNPANRVGFLDIKPGQKLFDTVVVGGKVEPGIYTQISQASCIGLAEQAVCQSPQEIAGAVAAATAQQLNVPDWAVEKVTQAPDPARKIEGLIAPGVTNFNPSLPTVEGIAQIIAASVKVWDKAGISQAGDAIGTSVYDGLVAASLVEKEGRHAEFGRIARVIANRIAKPMKMEFDSTVNYDLADQEVATRTVDRQTVTPWNTYASEGLPATPIGSPSVEALTAVIAPTPGPWFFFVTVDKQGTTEFSETFEQHLQLQQQALDSGVLDSER